MPPDHGALVADEHVAADQFQRLARQPRHTIHPLARLVGAGPHADDVPALRHGPPRHQAAVALGQRGVRLDLRRLAAVGAGRGKRRGRFLLPCGVQSGMRVA